VLRLLLVRHGVTDWNEARRYQGQTDTPLNDEGRRQARLLARTLADETVSRLYTSDLKRAAETAAILAEALGVHVESTKALREMRFGVLEGRTWAEAYASDPEMLAAWLADRDTPPPGGETQTAFTTRIADFLDTIRREDDGQTVLLVAHGGPLKEIIRLALDLPPEKRWGFRLDNTSLSELHLYDDVAILVRLNSTCHLGPGKPPPEETADQ
jgi:broad specificity phosphatase PhoE